MIDDHVMHNNQQEMEYIETFEPQQLLFSGNLLLSKAKSEKVLLMQESFYRHY